jgi:hypothetical protein
MTNHPNRNKRETWFSPLPEDEDEARLDRMVERYGYARILAALIRKMPKDVGIKQLPVDPAELGF